MTRDDPAIGKLAQKPEEGTPSTAPEYATDAVAAAEVELILEVGRGDPQILAGHPAVAAWLVETRAPQRLTTRYFDDPEGTLRRHGWCLRVRTAGQKRKQGLKAIGAGGGAIGALQGRHEHEWATRQTTPDRARLDPALRSLGIAPPEALAPVFETEITRHEFVLKDPQGRRMIMAFDKGEVRAGKRKRKLQQLEIESEGAPADSLFTLAEALRADFGLRLARASKAETGFDLADGAPGWAKSRLPGLDGSLTVSAAFRLFGLTSLGQLMANEACALADAHIEGVHQMRVALRRLRSVFTIYRDLIDGFRAEHFRGELRWIASEMGDTRDLDVLIHETLPLAPGDDRSGKAARALIPAFAEMREAARDRAVAAIRSPRYAALCWDLFRWLQTRAWHETATPPQQVWLEGPLVDIAPIWLDRREAKVQKLGRAVHGLGPEMHHELRIRIKKLRYLADFSAGAFPDPATKAYIKALSGMQDALGHMNDLVVAQLLLSRLRSLEVVAEDPALDLAGDILQEWLQRRGEAHIADLPKRWLAFEKQRPFWRS